MNEEKNFKIACQDEIDQQGKNLILKQLTCQWLEESIKTNYSYHFEWLGRPIIQYPQDIVGMQQLIWLIKPDLIIETGIARGGSLILYASILELIAQCGGPIDAKVLGVDIDIREHNKNAILKHPMSKRIEMIQGSSIDISIVEEVRLKAMTAKKIMVCLDSNHTHDHVLQELRHFAPMVSVGSYLIVFDTIVEDLPISLIKNRTWSKGNNPKTAVFEYLNELQNQSTVGINGQPLEFVHDKQIENQLLITVAPSGFLFRKP